MGLKDFIQNIIAFKCIFQRHCHAAIEYFTQLGYFHFVTPFSFESDGLLNIFSGIAKLPGMLHTES